MIDFFMKAVRESHYYPDGSVRPEYRKWLKAKGTSDEEIAATEKRTRDEIEDERLYGLTYEEKVENARNRLIGMSGLSTQELLTEGYADVDDIDEYGRVDRRFSFEDLL